MNCVRIAHYCFAVVVFTCGVLHAQTDSSTSGNSGQSAPPAAVPESTQASSKVGDSTQLLIVKFKKPKYPIGAEAQQIQGEVWVHLVITETGDVESADVITTKL